MRITLQQSGGVAYLPGLAKDVEVDTADLEPHEADHVEALARRSRDEARGEHQPPTVVPDAREYRLRISEDAAEEHVAVHDPLPSGATADLIQWLLQRSGGA